MDASAIEHALSRLGARVEYHTDIELLLVGGAAGMLTGVLPASIVTNDCDVMDYAPDAARSAVELASDAVAAELGLAEGWLNSVVQIRRDTLPDGWKERRIWIGRYGRLLVYGASRLDLIAMKVISGREKDRQHLAAMRVRRDEVGLVRATWIRSRRRVRAPQRSRMPGSCWMD